MKQLAAGSGSRSGLERNAFSTLSRCSLLRISSMNCFRKIIILWLLLLPPHRLSAGSSSFEALRRKRYLVYPPPGAYAPSKVQLILGLGLPMEVDVSMIIGYVMKFNYALPHNASYLTNPYVRYERSIEEPLRPAIGQGEAVQIPGVMSRWEVYDAIRMLLGKPCLLKAICEAAAIPFNMDHGLSSQLLHILLTPSSTSEPHSTGSDQQYSAAEALGREDAANCHGLFPECPESFLEYFTQVHQQLFV